MRVKVHVCEPRCGEGAHVFSFSCPLEPNDGAVEIANYLRAAGKRFEELRLAEGAPARVIGYAVEPEPPGNITITLRYRNIDSDPAHA